jgi:hypothetical protein
MYVTSILIEQNRRTGDEREQCAESPPPGAVDGFEYNRIWVLKVMAQSHIYVLIVQNLNLYFPDAIRRTRTKMNIGTKSIPNYHCRSFWVAAFLWA